jgi:putative ABC transport system permease protein
MTLAIRTTTATLTLAGAVRDTVKSIDRDQPVHSIRTMDELMTRALAPARFTLLLLSIFAGVSAVLAVTGIYGVMSHAVTERTHEIGIRMALGAETSDVLKLVVGQGLMLTIAGVVIGIGASLAVTRLITGLLYAVSATDAVTFAVVPVLLTGVALAASFIPARRAMKVDPMVALRYE